MDELISIVVPVYNVEKYLERCVKSIINQTYKNLEIILVDDGSKDNSGNLADALKEIDKRIRVIHQKNKGLSGARNTGILEAKGDYIGFIDSDDYIDPQMYETLYNNLVKENADISCIGVEMVNDNGHIRYFNDQLDQYLVLNKKEALYYNVCKENYVVSTSSCDKLYKKSIILKKLFIEGVIYEDLRNMAFYLSNANKVVYENKPYYKYYSNNMSITRGTFSPRWYTWVDAHAEVREVINKEAPEYLCYVNANYVHNVLSILYKARHDNNKEIKKALIRGLKTTVKENNIKWEGNLKKRVRIFMFSKHLYYFLMNIVERTR